MKMQAPTIKKLITALTAELEKELCLETAENTQIIDDIEWSLYRLETAEKGSKLICVHDTEPATNLIIEEGCWVINEKACYLAKPKK